MENTILNKQLFMINYFGQNVALDNTVAGIDLFDITYISECGWPSSLKLKNIKQLSDEDAEVISKYMHWGKDPKSVKQTIVLLNLNSFPSIVIDYLRLSGYAVPWMGLSVEKQIQYGWVEYE